MLVICPDCENRYEIPKAHNNLNIDCPCGKNLSVLPRINQRKRIGGEATGTCPLCGQDYNLHSLRSGTEIVCNCGGLLVFSESAQPRRARGRRRDDQASRLREAELQGLIDTSRLIHSSIHDLDRLLRLIVRITSDMLDSEGTTIVLRDVEPGDLVFHSIAGKESSKLESFRIAEGEGIAGTCVQTR